MRGLALRLRAVRRGVLVASGVALLGCAAAQPVASSRPTPTPTPRPALDAPPAHQRSWRVHCEGSRGALDLQVDTWITVEGYQLHASPVNALHLAVTAEDGSFVVDRTPEDQPSVGMFVERVERARSREWLVVKSYETHTVLVPERRTTSRGGETEVLPAHEERHGIYGSELRVTIEDLGQDRYEFTAVELDGVTRFPLGPHAPCTVAVWDRPPEPEARG
jgi:hypothetical protein